MPGDTSESGDPRAVVGSAARRISDEMPDGSTWTMLCTSGAGVFASGEFSDDRLQHPTSTAVGTFLPRWGIPGHHCRNLGVRVIRPSFEIDSPTETLGVVLGPHVEQPVLASLMLVDRAVSLDLGIWDAATTVLLVSESIDETVPGTMMERNER